MNCETVHGLSALLGWVVDGLTLFHLDHKAESSDSKSSGVSDQSHTELNNDSEEMICVSGAKLNITALEEFQNELKKFYILIVYLYGILMMLPHLADVQRRGTLMHFISSIDIVLHNFDTALDAQIVEEKQKLIPEGHGCIAREINKEEIERILKKLRPDLHHHAAGKEEKFRRIKHLAIEHGNAALKKIVGIFTTDDVDA